jgi:hypothetical protein
MATGPFALASPAGECICSGSVSQAIDVHFRPARSGFDVKKDAEAFWESCAFSELAIDKFKRGNVIL